MTRYKIAKPSKGGRQNKAAQAQVEVEIHSQLAVLNYPVIVELKKRRWPQCREVFGSIFPGKINNILLSSMFPGQINDNSVSRNDGRPRFSPVETGNGTEESPIEAATKNLSTFSHLLPHITAVTAKKQGRRSTREHIRFVVNSEPAGE